MKAILVVDMPKCCGETPCPCWNADDRKDWCGATNVTLTGCDIEKERPSWCPLKPLPEKKEPFYDINIQEYDIRIDGWNACLEELLNTGLNYSKEGEELEK